MSVETEVAGLERLSADRLRERWVELVDPVVPVISPKLLRLALAWELQARAYGCHSRETTRRLDLLSTQSLKTARPCLGVELVREWRGKVHVVTIGADQVIRCGGREWRSLSEVARAITGTRWSGPAFFGLKKAAAA